MRPLMPKLPLPLLVLLAGLLIACGEDDTTTAEPAAEGEVTTTPAPAEEEPAAGGEGEGKRDRDDEKPKPPEPTGTKITTAGSQFGEAIFDSEDRAIYFFDKETSQRSRCYGECAVAWPPVLTKGEPRAGGDARSKLLGTTERRDGTTQVTYAGRPLYYYVDDPPGQILCHNVPGFGGLWLAVQPGGEAFS